MNDSQVSPLRCLPPLSEHPTPAASDTTLSVLEASIRLDKLGDWSSAAARTLRTFLDNLDRDGKKALVADIGICHDDDEQLIRLANHLIDAVLKPFQLAGGQAPPPLTTPPSEGVGLAIDLAMVTIGTSTREGQRSLRTDCLRRDDYQCVYSGVWDFVSYRKEIVVPPPRAECGTTECAHIIPFALGSFNETDAVQTRNKAIIWFALHRYFPALAGKMDASSIHQRGNAMILSTPVHNLFGMYELAFLPQGATSYRTVRFFEAPMQAKSKSGSPLAQFTSADDSVPMPDDDYLQTHHVVSQILQVSGLGRQISMAAEQADLDLDCHALHPSGCTDVGPMLSRLLLINVRADTQSRTRENDGVEHVDVKEE